MDEPVTDDAVAVAVTLTIRQHERDALTPWRPGTCRQCQPDGTCPQLGWAVTEQARLEADAARRVARHRMSGGNPAAGTHKGDT